MLSDNEDISEDRVTKNKRKRGNKRETAHSNGDNEESEDKSSIISGNSSRDMIIDDKCSLHSELSNTLTIEDKNNEKLFRHFMVQERRPAVSMYSKHDLLRVCCNAFAYHRLMSASKLMVTLVRDNRISHLLIVKSAFILFTQNPSDSSLLVKSMKKLSKLDVNKREIMLEVILHFLRINDKNGAKKYIESNESVLKMTSLRKNTVIDTYLKCFVCFVDYLEWKQSIEESNDDIFYHSNRVIAEKTKLSLKNIINETKDLVLDYFVIICIEMYKYSQQFSEAFEILQVYIENNPESLNPYIYLYNFCVEYPDYSTSELKTNALKHILKDSPENPLVLHSVQTDDQIVDKFQTLIAFIDHKNNFYDLNAWTQLKDLITSIEDNSVKKLIKKLWKDIYEEYWVRLHCNVTKIKEINENIIELIRYKQKVIEFFYSSPHLYVIQSNEKIDEYRSLKLLIDC